MIRFTVCGSAKVCSHSRWNSDSGSDPFLFPKFNHNKNSDSTWPVKAFVLATPTSGPAWMYIPQSVSRAMVEPTTFTMPKLRAPQDCASRSASSVSAVSPDWEMPITTSSSLISGRR